MTKITPVIAAAIVSLAAPAHAAEWYAYSPDHECHSQSAPGDIIKWMRKEFRQEPTVEDTKDNSGKVTETHITVDAPMADHVLGMRMFRGRALCEQFRDAHKDDTHRYD